MNCRLVFVKYGTPKVFLNIEFGFSNASKTVQAIRLGHVNVLITPCDVLNRNQLYWGIQDHCCCTDSSKFVLPVDIFSRGCMSEYMYYTFE